MAEITESNQGGNRFIPAQLRGEIIGYACQNAIGNMAANLWEPLINYQIQTYYAGVGADKKPAAHGNYTQNLAGELAGDLIGSGALIAAETLFPKELHQFTHAARKIVDPLYDAAAKWVFRKEQAAPDFEEKVEKWKTFQERNLVRSAIMVTAGVAGNLATQKWIMGNPSPTKLIFAGKLASSAVTTALGLAVRLAYPKQMKGLDKWMGAKIAPLMKDIGDDPAECDPEDASPKAKPTTHAEKVLAEGKEECEKGR